MRKALPRIKGLSLRLCVFAREYSFAVRGCLESAGCAGALRLEIVKSRNDRIGVVQKLLPGGTESGILVYFASRDELIDFDLEVVEFHNGVAEFSLVNLESGFVEFNEQVVSIFIGRLTGNDHAFGLCFQRGEHRLNFSDCRRVSQWSSDEQSERAYDCGERNFLHH